MKQLLLTISVLTVYALCCSAQSDTITHIVERGESLEYLAEKYRITEADIKNCNSDLDLFYTGMEIRLPVLKQIKSIAASNASSSIGEEFLAECILADEDLNKGNYKKAEKEYTDLIKRYSPSLSCTDAYHGRALAYYNRGKWKKAIKDFNTVLSNGDCTEKVRSQCENLLATAKEKREEQLEQRGEMWGQLFAVAAVTTATVISAKQQAKEAERQASAKAKNASNGGGSNYDEPEEDEEDLSSGKSKSSSCPSRKWNCGGSGICAMCGGDGFMSGQFGEGANSHKCTNCGGSGNCKYCN